MTDHNATVPMRRTRVSREFMCHGMLLTPAQERLHVLDTARVPAPPPEALTTGRLEECYARRIKRTHGRSWVLGVAAVVAMAMLGLGVGALLVEVVR